MRTELTRCLRSTSQKSGRLPVLSCPLGPARSKAAMRAKQRSTSCPDVTTPACKAACSEVTVASSSKGSEVLGRLSRVLPLQRMTSRRHLRRRSQACLPISCDATRPDGTEDGDGGHWRKCAYHLRPPKFMRMISKEQTLISGGTSWAFGLES
jgi:hypothetical protein